MLYVDCVASFRHAVPVVGRGSLNLKTGEEETKFKTCQSPNEI